MAEKATPRERAAAPKSRGEKSRPPTAAAARADVVPGRLPEAEWLSLLAAERADEDAADILAELLGRVMDECSKANAARQRVPFTVGQARDALLQIAQWRFLVRDEGETDPEGDGAWREDEEPKPCATDSWAQGSIPVLRTQGSGAEPAAAPGSGWAAPPTPSHPHRAPRDPRPTPGPPLPPPGQVSGVRALCQRRRQDPPCPSQVPTATVLPVPGPSRPELLPGKAAIAPRPPDGKTPRARPPLPRPAPLRLARPPAPCLSPGPAELPGQPEEGWRPLWSSHGDVEGSGAAGVSSHRPPLPPPSGTSLVTIWPGRPSHSTGAKREGSGAVLGVPRLGPGSRPERWSGPRWRCWTQARRPSRQHVPRVAAGAAGGRSWAARGCPGGRSPWRGDSASPPPRGSLQPPGPVPWQLGSLLDSARLAPGVTIRRGGSVKHGLCIPTRGEEEEEETGEAKRDLRPIRPTVPFPAIAARQVTGDGEW
ncbi:LOW QUALITY PROTEIN: uncharacterized protein C2orf81 homolog [Theristicus caerulescens]